LIRRGKGQRQAELNFGSITMTPSEQTISVEGKEIDSFTHGITGARIPDAPPARVVSSRELLEHPYDFTWEHHSNVIEAHVSNLRRKLRNGTENTVVKNLAGAAAGSPTLWRMIHQDANEIPRKASRSYSSLH